MKVIGINSKYFESLAAVLLATATFAQAPNDKSVVAKNVCSRPIVLKIDSAGNQMRYELNGRTFKGYPLDDIAHATMNCPARALFVVATWDVPLYVVTTPGKLQLDHVRYFIKGRDEHTYTELTYGRMYPSLPVTPDVAPLPEDDGTLHLPTKIPDPKGSK